jgi:hypothetical protein
LTAWAPLARPKSNALAPRFSISCARADGVDGRRFCDICSTRK